MTSDNFSVWRKEHTDECRDKLRDDALRALRNWPGKTAAFLLIASSLNIALSVQINFAILITTALSYYTTFGITLLRNSIYTLLTAMLIYLIDPVYLAINAIQVVQGLLGGIIVSWLFFARIQTRFYCKSIDADTRQHLYKQLTKLVYPHQFAQIKAGDQLKKTMPLAPAWAIVNAFDMQGSSNIKHEKIQAFFCKYSGLFHR